MAVDSGKGRPEAADDWASFLADSNRISAIQTLRYRFDKLSPSERIDVIGDLGRGNQQANGGSAGASSAKPKAGVDKAVEDFLVSELSDPGISYGEGMSWGEMSFDNPRVRDFAAFQLSQVWPKKYRFVNDPSESARDRQCLVSLNAYRVSRGLTPVSVPAKRAIVPASPAKIQPLLQALVSGPIGDRQKTEAAIQAMGPSALPAITKFSAGLDVRNPVRRDLDEIAARIADLVAEVKLLNVPKPAAGFADQAGAWKGKPLTASMLRSLVQLAVKTWPAKAKGVTIQCDRDTDGLGIVVTLDLGPSRQTGASGGDFDYAMAVNVNGKPSGGETGAGTADSLISDSFFDNAKKALASGPFVPFSFYISFDRGHP